MERPAVARYFPMRNYDLAWIWNLSYGVGTGRANRPDDVQLIQHCFNRLTAYIDFYDRTGRPITTYLKRDGLFGPKTQEAIWAFQNYIEGTGRYIISDGAVDPCDQTGYTNPGQIYTIVYFNRVHRDFYGTMMDENEFPDPLKQVAIAST
jgi:hypothetical protein